VGAVVRGRRESNDGGCVLLVDAGSGAAEAIVRTLASHGVDHVVVHRWPDLLERLVDEAPWLVILELAMSGAAGTRLIGMVRAAQPDTTLVVVSDPEVIRVAALEAGASLVVASTDLRPLQALLCQGAVSQTDASPPSGDLPSRGRRSTKASS
jgi:DNA-binding response OmpR family regulator